LEEQIEGGMDAPDEEGGENVGETMQEYSYGEEELGG
jgi:hypothetical protein